MNTNQKISEKMDRKIILSTLWIFAMLNYVVWYAWRWAAPAGLPETKASRQTELGGVL